MAYVYILRCADGSLYTGWTPDLCRRLRAHHAGRAAKYTRSRRPVELAAWLSFRSAGDARALEARFKRMSRAQKMAALLANEAFGIPVHKTPHTDLARSAAIDGEHTMPAMSPPTGEELRTLAQRAKTAQARISTDKGDLVFAFYPDDAPQHCAAFIKLGEAGFYDGLTFHRVDPGFVIQGGDPSGNGTGGPGYKLQAEFNERPHVRGAVAMARAGHPDSAGSQFYICLDDARFLDREYTVFGQLIDGFDVLDAIRIGDAMNKVSIEQKTAV